MSELQELFEKSLNSPHNAAFMSAFKKILVARGFFQTYLSKRIREHIDFENLEITDLGNYVDEKLKG
ncbi:MAG: Rpn family recombination-promoting nuclease/putative transposase [Desulfobacterales bacterium]